MVSATSTVVAGDASRPGGAGPRAGAPSARSTRLGFATGALVLRLAVSGESDRVVTLYTEARGKVAAFARAARKSRRRFGAALAYFVLGEAVLTERPGQELMSLESFSVRRDFSRLASDIGKMAHASYGTELVRELVPLFVPDARVLALLVELFATLETNGPSANGLRVF